MSFPETPALTDTERILQKCDDVLKQQAAVAEALNNLGQNVQWIIDQASGIFKVFNSPQFMNQILSGGINVAGPQSAAGPAEGPAENGPGTGQA